MSSIVTLIPYKALPNDDLEEDYSQKHIKLGVGQQILGRGDFLSISDKRVSRSQATLTVEPEDDKMKITLKRLGMNAMFVVRNDGQWVPLEKEQDIELEDGDCFSMCVREFMFRIKVEHSDPKPPSQPAATQEDSQLHAKKSNETKELQPVVEHKEVKQAAEEPQEGWFIKKKKEPKSQPMEVEHKEHKEHIAEHTNENNSQNKKHKQQENEVNEMKEQSSQDNDGKKNKRKITEEESDEEEFVEKVQKQIEKHQSTEDVSKNKKQKVVEVEDDAALARRLQKELEEEDNKAQQAKNKNKKKATNKPKHAEEDDEALAKRLQKELEQEEEEQLQKDAQLAKSLAKGHKSKGKKLAYQSGRPRRLCTMKKTKYEDDQVWSSEESWDEGEQDAASGGGSGSSDEAESWNSDDSLHENASQSGSDGEYKTASKKKTKPMCQFGAACYRTNPDHLKAFRHPKKKK